MSNDYCPNPDPRTLLCFRCRRPVEATATGWRHVKPRCGAWMPNVEDRCDRYVGHKDSHRRRIVMETERARKAAQRAA